MDGWISWRGWVAKLAGLVAKLVGDGWLSWQCLWLSCGWVAKLAGLGG